MRHAVLGPGEVDDRDHDDRTGPELFAPRRAGALRLVQQRRDPRQEQESSDHQRPDQEPCADPALGIRLPPSAPQGDDPDGGEQPHGPVVRPQEQCGDHRSAQRDEHPRATGGAGTQQVVDEQVAGRGERDDQRVHACLGCIADPEGHQRGDRHCDQTRASGAEASAGHAETGDRVTPRRSGGPRTRGAVLADPATGQVHERQCQDREHARQRPCPPVGVGAEGVPHMQQHVEERWVAVPAQGRGDVADRQVGDVDGQRFVQPQPGAGQEPQDHTDDHGERGRQDQQTVDRRFRQIGHRRVG